MMKELYMRLERKRRKWTQGYVAEKLNVTVPTVHSLEKGKKRPSYDLLIALENLFQLPYRYLLAQVGEENPTFSCYCKNLDSFIVAREGANKQA